MQKLYKDRLDKLLRLVKTFHTKADAKSGSAKYAVYITSYAAANPKEGQNILSLINHYEDKYGAIK